MVVSGSGQAALTSATKASFFTLPGKVSQEMLICSRPKALKSVTPT